MLLLTPFELRSEAERSLGLEAGALTWAGPFDPASDPLWQRWQAGDVTERDYWAERAAAHDLDTLAFMAQFFEPGGDHLIRREMWDLVRSHQAAGGRVAILTNDLRAFHGPEWTGAVTVLGEVDALVDGSVTRVLKPDPRAYEAALQSPGRLDPVSRLRRRPARQPRRRRAGRDGLRRFRPRRRGRIDDAGAPPSA